MQRETLKTLLFRAFETELKTAGATKANTKVKRLKHPKAWGNRDFTYLGKLGRRFVGMVHKATGMGFILLISIASLVPKNTPILVPNDHAPILAPQHSSQMSLADFSNFPLSGTLQLYVAQYGANPPVSIPRPHTTYDVCPGTHLRIISGEFNPPATYISMISGSMLKARHDPC
jgi:hypothetical protein